MHSASYPLRTLVLCFVIALAWVTYGDVSPGSSVAASPVQAKARVTGRVELINSKLRKPGARLDTSGVAVWLESRGPRIQGARPRQKLNQQGKRFIPHVLIIERGTEVDFPNSDPFYHNVFSLFDGRRFDLGLYASGESRPIVFNRSGISYIYCNIHPSMSAVIVSVDTPFFAVTDVNGNFSIPDVPPGTYDLKIWHERTTPAELNLLTREVKVAAGSNPDVGLIRVNEAGYIPQTHLNKHGQTYDDERTNPRYKP